MHIPWTYCEAFMSGLAGAPNRVTVINILSAFPFLLDAPDHTRVYISSSRDARQTHVECHVQYHTLASRVRWRWTSTMLRYVANEIPWAKDGRYAYCLIYRSQRCYGNNIISVPNRWLEHFFFIGQRCQSDLTLSSNINSRKDWML
jgi:hypothetical protein